MDSLKTQISPKCSPLFIYECKCEPLRLPINLPLERCLFLEFYVSSYIQLVTQCCPLSAEEGNVNYCSFIPLFCLACNHKHTHMPRCIRSTSTNKTLQSTTAHTCAEPQRAVTDRAQLHSLHTSIHFNYDGNKNRYTANEYQQWFAQGNTPTFRGTQ